MKQITKSNFQLNNIMTELMGFLDHDQKANMKFRCKHCATEPELHGTGYSEPHPAYFCPVCKHPYWWLVTYDINVQGIIKGRSAKLLSHPKKGTVEDWMKKHGDSYWWR